MFSLRLGEVYLSQGERGQARALFEAVLATSREAGYRHLEGVTQRFLGQLLAADDPTAAAAHLASALRLLQDRGIHKEVAKVLVAQAELGQAAGDVTGARARLERALALFERLGTLDEPPRVRAALAALPSVPSV
jgi:tetratricopeptide (TPR) repeat protein